jgi:hypothetical protein
LAQTFSYHNDDGNPLEPLVCCSLKSSAKVYLASKQVIAIAPIINEHKVCMIFIQRLWGNSLIAESGARALYETSHISTITPGMTATTIKWITNATKMTNILHFGSQHDDPELLVVLQDKAME